MEIPPTAVPGGQYDMVQQVWGTQCHFDGDFDARVQYKLLTWPAASGARVQLSAWIFPTSTWSAAARTSTLSGDRIDGNIGGLSNGVSSSANAGTLRIERHGATMTSLYLDANGAWRTLVSADATGPVTIGLQLFASGHDWGRQDVSAAFDNFSVSAPARCQ